MDASTQETAFFTTDGTDDADYTDGKGWDGQRERLRRIRLFLTTDYTDFLDYTDGAAKIGAE